MKPKIEINRFLQRQINKFLSPELIEQNESIRKFIEAVNQTYINYEKDAELFEQSTRLNDIEYREINKKLKDELLSKSEFQNQLIMAINQLNVSKLSTHRSTDLNDLLQILNDEIKFKQEFQDQLYHAKLEAEKASEAKSDFLSIMSHEIRTPLNAIIGMIYIMEKEQNLDHFKENLSVLRLSANNLFLLINDILDYNKIEAGKIDLEEIPFHFTTLVNQIKSSLTVKAEENLNKISVYTDVDFNPNVIGDPLRIGQIITNLVSNACKFTQNGEIKISIETLTIEKEMINFRVKVSDNGIGIEKENFELIFQKFSQAESKTTRKYGGTGLGLIITKKLLQLMNSDIALKSKVGVGTTFYFDLKLPLVISDVQQASAINEFNEIQLNGLKVLLVEDNLINTKIAVKILTQWGIIIETAENGLIGVDKFQNNRYDLILMDLSMPVMDGYEATSIIRTKDAKIPILALTASASYGYLEKAMKMGVNDYIIKPFNPKELNYKLSKYYQEKQLSI